MGLLTRINDRKPLATTRFTDERGNIWIRRDGVLVNLNAERMSPFMRRLAEKRLPVKDQTSYILGAHTPEGSGWSA